MSTKLCNIWRVVVCKLEKERSAKPQIARHNSVYIDSHYRQATSQRLDFSLGVGWDRHLRGLWKALKGLWKRHLGLKRQNRALKRCLSSKGANRVLKKAFGPKKVLHVWGLKGHWERKRVLGIPKGHSRKMGSLKHKLTYFEPLLDHDERVQWISEPFGIALIYLLTSCKINHGLYNINNIRNPLELFFLIGVEKGH